MTHRKKLLCIWGLFTLFWSCVIFIRCLYVSENSLCQYFQDGDESEPCEWLKYHSLRQKQSEKPQIDTFAQVYKETLRMKEVFLDIDSSYKTILIWNKLHHLLHPGEDEMKTFKGLSCLHSKCVITKDRNQTNVDAIIISSSRLLQIHDVPKRETSNQKLILEYFEPLLKPNMSSLLKFVDWISSYHNHSDLSCPYGLYQDNEVDTMHINYDYEHYFSVKQSILWLKPDDTNNGNYSLMKFKRNLVSNITLISKDSLEDDKQYLSYMPELKFCVLFITKCNAVVHQRIFWDALQHGVIPIVFGSGELKDYGLLPPRSYIRAEDYRTISRLSKYVSVVSQDVRLYRSYFAWRLRGTVIAGKSVLHKCFWCSLCEALHDDMISKTTNVHADNYFSEEKCK